MKPLQLLHALLTTPEGLTLRQMARRLRVDERTVRRYLVAIRRAGFSTVVVGSTPNGGQKWSARV